MGTGAEVEQKRKKRSRNSAISDDPGQELGGMMTMMIRYVLRNKFFGGKRRGEIKNEMK